MKSTKLLKILEVTRRQPQRLTEEQVDYLGNVIKQVSDADCQRKQSLRFLSLWSYFLKKLSNPLKVVGV